MSQLYTLLKSTLNASATGGLYPDQAPEAVTPPYAVYAEIASPPNVSLGGQSNLKNTRLQLTVWSKTKVESKTVAATLYALVVAQALYGSPTVFTATPVNEGTSVVDPETRLYGTILEFSVWHF